MSNTERKTSAATATGSNGASSNEEADTDNVVEKQPTTSISDPTERRTRRQSVALVILASMGVMYTIYFGRAILMPIAFAIVLALLLRPLVRRGRRWRIPEGVSAALLLLGLVGILVAGVVTLADPVKSWIDEGPDHLQKFGSKLYAIRKQIKNINDASAKVEEIAGGESKASKNDAGPFPFAPNEAPDETTRDTEPESKAWPKVPAKLGVVEASRPPPAPPNQTETEPLAINSNEPVQVQVQQPRLSTGIGYLSTTGGVMAQVFISLVLTYFLLASGDTLINNVLRILPLMREKRNVVELVYAIERAISSYLLTVSAVNLGLGTAVALVMWFTGMPNPLLWGAMAALFNFVPFVGALVGVMVIFFVSVLTFDSLSYAMLAPALFWGLTVIEGNIVTPHLLGRSMSLNPIVVFIGLAFWGWMWGIGGALLAVPILAIIKVTCDQFERTRPLATLIGGGEQT